MTKKGYGLPPPFSRPRIIPGHIPNTRPVFAHSQRCPECGELLDDSGCCKKCGLCVPKRFVA